MEASDHVQTYGGTTWVQVCVVFPLLLWFPMQCSHRASTWHVSSQFPWPWSMATAIPPSLGHWGFFHYNNYATVSLIFKVSFNTSLTPFIMEICLSLYILAKEGNGYCQRKWLTFWWENMNFPTLTIAILALLWSFTKHFKESRFEKLQRKTGKTLNHNGVRKQGEKNPLPNPRQKICVEMAYWPTLTYSHSRVHFSPPECVWNSVPTSLGKWRVLMYVKHTRA